MPTPTLPNTYPPKFRRILERVPFLDEPLVIQYKTIKALRHDRSYFYGYRRSIQRRYDSLLTRSTKSSLVQQELLDLSHLLDLIPQVQLSAAEHLLTLTFLNPQTNKEEDPLAAALDETPVTNRPIDILADTVIEETIPEAAMLVPSDVVGNLPSTAELLGIESTEIQEQEDIEAEHIPKDDSPAAVASLADLPIEEQSEEEIKRKRIASLRTGYDNLINKPTRSATQEKTLANITSQLMELDDTFITPETQTDLDAIESKSQEFKI